MKKIFINLTFLTILLISTYAKTFSQNFTSAGNIQIYTGTSITNLLKYDYTYERAGLKYDTEYSGYLIEIKTEYF